MKPLPQRRLVSPLALGAVLLAALQAQAQIGPIVSGPGGNPMPPIVVPVPQDPGTGEFDFGSPLNRVEVTYATGAGAFEKWLKPEPDQNGDGAVDLLDLSLFLANPHLTLNEYLTVGPGPAWTDWHEEILTPDWQWGTVSLTTPGVSGGPTGLTVNHSGSKVDFYFDPLAPGTDVDIRKELFFTGAVTPDMERDFLAGEFAVRVAEYPTSVPEPGVVPLAGLALCGGALVRLRRRWDEQARRNAS